LDHSIIHYPGQDWTTKPQSSLFQTMIPNSSSSSDDDDDRQTIIRELPKVELHAHLNGTIREKTLIDLACERDVVLNEKYHFFNNLHGQNSSIKNTTGNHGYHPKRSLSECFEIFGEIAKCVDDLDALQRVTKEALDDFASHNVVYLELRSTPKRLYYSSPLKKKQTKKKQTEREQQEKGSIVPSSELASKRDYCETVLNTIMEFHNNTHQSDDRHKMICRFIVAIDRAQPIEAGMEHVDLAIELKNDPKFRNLVVGMDLGGNPLKRDFVDFQECFEKARSHHLYVTLHCAEVPCEEKKNETETTTSTLRAYQDAENILNFRPDRLGHALLLPPSLQKKLNRSKIPIETCPTSNVMTLELNDTTHKSSTTESVVEGLKRHPHLLTWLIGDGDNNNDTGTSMENKKFPYHPIAICTDDNGVFNTDATQEVDVVLTAFRANGIGIAQLKDLICQSMDFAFCDDKTKRRIKPLLKKKFEI